MIEVLIWNALSLEKFMFQVTYWFCFRKSTSQSWTQLCRSGCFWPVQLAEFILLQEIRLHLLQRRNPSSSSTKYRTPSYFTRFLLLSGCCSPYLKEMQCVTSLFVCLFHQLNKGFAQTLGSRTTVIVFTFSAPFRLGLMLRESAARREAISWASAMWRTKASSFLSLVMVRDNTDNSKLQGNYVD